MNNNSYFYMQVAGKTSRGYHLVSDHIYLLSFFSASTQIAASSTQSVTRILNSHTHVHLKLTTKHKLILKLENKSLIKNFTYYGVTLY